MVLEDDSVYAVIKTTEYNGSNYALVQQVKQDIAIKRELDTAFEIVEEVLENDKVKLVPVKDIITKTALVEKFKSKK